MPSRLVVLPVLALVLAVPACSKKTPAAGQDAPKPVAGTEVAAFIDEQLAPKFAPLSVGKAACPDQMKLEKDKPEACSMKIEGLPVRIKVQRADNGLYTAVNDQAVIPVETLEGQLTTQASQSAKVPVQIDCGDEAVWVLDVPANKECTAKKPDGTVIDLVVTINDVSGSFSFGEKKDDGS